MGFDDVEVTVEIVVADADAHPGHLLAIGADGDAAHQPFFAERAVVVVQQQQTLRGVAGHEEIWPAILIDVEGNGGEPVGALDRGDTRFL